MPEYPADLYRQYRPTYPPELYEIVYKFHRLHPAHEFEFAVDVGTGTGQTALELSKDFKKVLGLDYAQSMLSEASQAPNISYSVCKAEEISTKLDPLSVDLITVSTAAHWFDMPKFYNECMQVLKPSGTLAVWAYGHFVCPLYPEITRLHLTFAMDAMGPYWDPGRDALDNLYSDPDFVMSPFKVFDRRVYPDGSNPILLSRKWSLSYIKGYLSTWSCYKKFKQVHPEAGDPIDQFMEECFRILGKRDMEAELEIYWPIALILAKKALN